MKFYETEKIELKSSLNDTLIKEIVAFLNSIDGTIYIGISDDGKVLGVKNIDIIQKQIADIYTAGILPNPQDLVKMETVNIE